MRKFGGGLPVVLVMIGDVAKQLGDLIDSWRNHPHRAQGARALAGIEKNKLDAADADRTCRRMRYETRAATAGFRPTTERTLKPVVPGALAQDLSAVSQLPLPVTSLCGDQLKIFAGAVCSPNRNRMQAWVTPKGTRTWPTSAPSSRANSSDCPMCAECTGAARRRASLPPTR